MKRTFVKIVSKKVLATLALTGVVLMVVPSQTRANTNNIEILSDNNQATVQYTGSVDDALFFNVKLGNANGDKFALIIKDESGNILYSKEYSDKNFSKRIKLVKNDDNRRYNFEIKSSNKDLEQTFAVKADVKIIDEVVVTKL